MEISITRTMDSDHRKIQAILERFEEEINQDSEKATMTFNIFKWNLEKHFFTEEKVIISSYIAETEDEKEDMSTILNEHVEIQVLIKIIEEALSKNKKPDLSNIKKILKSHSKFEDEIFYPKLDEILNDKQKQEIIIRIKEIIIN